MKSVGGVSVYIEKKSLCYECGCHPEERSGWLVVGYV